MSSSIGSVSKLGKYDMQNMLKLNIEWHSQGIHTKFADFALLTINKSDTWYGLLSNIKLPTSKGEQSFKEIIDAIWFKPPGCIIEKFTVAETSGNRKEM